MIIAGVDEVGRGALAGPVVAAAVILNEKIELLNDSKKISKKVREKLYPIIMESSESISIGIKWNDKDLKIKWPIKKPTLSNKDKNYYLDEVSQD